MANYSGIKCFPYDLPSSHNTSVTERRTDRRQIAVARQKYVGSVPTYYEAVRLAIQNLKLNSQQVDRRTEGRTGKTCNAAC